MVADSLEELHAFAKKILVKPHFLHVPNNAKLVHYDINEEQYLSAILFGAKLVSGKDIVQVGRKMK